MKIKFAIIFLAFLANSIYAQKEITLLATGAVEYPVDKVAIKIIVNTIGDELSKVNDENHKNSLNILSILQKYGFNKENIQTLNSSISDNYSFKETDKYISTTEYKILLSDLELYDQIKKELLVAKASKIEFDEVDTDRDKYHGLALKKAIDKAIKRATLIAESLGSKQVLLTKIIEGEKNYRELYRELENNLLNEQINVVPPPVKSGDVPIKESTITNIKKTIVVRILAVFKIIEN